MRKSTIGMSITRFAPARQPDRFSDKDTGYLGDPFELPPG